jgi:hypothetical protein
MRDSPSRQIGGTPEIHSRAFACIRMHSHAFACIRAKVRYDYPGVVAFQRIELPVASKQETPSIA